MGTVETVPSQLIDEALAGGVDEVGVGRGVAGLAQLGGNLGAVVGGLVVASATRAVPKMMSRMMAGMMREMMSQVGGPDCDPAEM